MMQQSIPHCKICGAAAGNSRWSRRQQFWALFTDVRWGRTRSELRLSISRASIFFISNHPVVLAVFFGSLSWWNTNFFFRLLGEESRVSSSILMYCADSSSHHSWSDRQSMVLKNTLTTCCSHSGSHSGTRCYSASVSMTGAVVA